MKLRLDELEKLPLSLITLYFKQVWDEEGEWWTEAETLDEKGTYIKLIWFSFGRPPQYFMDKMIVNTGAKKTYGNG